MKKLLAFILCLGSVLAFSQVKETESPPFESHSTDTHASEEPKQAEYPRGINVFMREVSQKINIKRIRGTGQVRANAKFSVNAQGEIEKISITGSNETMNKEVERVMKSMKTKWTPGEYKGSPVEIWYTLPFIVNFDN
ncbi:energy transducer TonB [Chryseobacterium soli]|uniref:energy transducer TonB n=1 Tax=Chryseobacterium soli TaxID=445961 RepID=UPI0029537110|nr:energy transducer TonB [Chryseobacterium soli]MDV7696730.1 energy transducer TonB [Chryseobacterium soli]